MSIDIFRVLYKKGLLFKNIQIYWKSLFVIIYPLLLLPVFLLQNTVALRCLYVVLLLAGFWVTEALPLPISSLLPMVLLPLMGIMDSDKTSICYFKETNMMFFGGLVIAIAVENCNLHKRVALHFIKMVGCSPRKLNIGLCSITMLVSMWISNTAAAAMMIPIVEATLSELEAQGIGQMFEAPDLDAAPPPDNKATKSDTDDEGPAKKPTRSTMCYFYSTGIAACIGGNGCVIGSGTNLTFKGIYETRFVDSPGVEFSKWLFLNVPIMFVCMYLTLIWLQFWYMGLFRPNSNDAKNLKLIDGAADAGKEVIIAKLVEMGPASFQEKAVGVMFVLSIFLWFFRKPQFIPGWAERITVMNVKDATPAIFIVVMLFAIPALKDFIYMFSKDDEKRPVKASPGLITWKTIQLKVSWGLLFLLGGGFALADASKDSGMSKLVADQLKSFASLPHVYVMMGSCGFAAFLTQFVSSNVAVANVLLPVLAEMAVVAKIHPMYLMMPATLACSCSYCLPVSTPPMALATAPCNMPTWEMFKAGIGVIVIVLATVFAIFPFYGPLIWDFNTFPDWAKTNSSIKAKN